MEIKGKHLHQLQKEASVKKDALAMTEWPVTDLWYKLAKRSFRSHVSGELRIRFSWENI